MLFKFFFQEYTTSRKIVVRFNFASAIKIICGFQVRSGNKCQCTGGCKPTCECVVSSSYCGPDCKCDSELCLYRQKGNLSYFSHLKYSCLGCSCVDGCRADSCPCFLFAFRCSMNCSCKSCLNAQSPADISFFQVRESHIAGAGAGVFVSQGLRLPDDFLITGIFFC